MEEEELFVYRSFLEIFNLLSTLKTELKRLYTLLDENHRRKIVLALDAAEKLENFLEKIRKETVGK
ncbi:MAG: hypothetical protein Q6368_000405 [Candidatus Baldrarchaeota archaeon]